MEINRPPTSSDPAQAAPPSASRDAAEAPRDYWRDIGMHLGVDDRDRVGQQLAAGDD